MEETEQKQEKPAVQRLPPEREEQPVGQRGKTEEQTGETEGLQRRTEEQQGKAEEQAEGQTGNKQSEPEKEERRTGFPRFLHLLRTCPVRSSAAAAIIAGLLLAGVTFLTSYNHMRLTDILSYLIIGVALGVFLIYPVILTILNLAAMFFIPVEEAKEKKWRYFALITITLGSIYSLLYTVCTEIQFDAEWSKQLYNSQTHQPIWTGGVLTVVVLSFVGVFGYLILSLGKLEKLPPLVTVLSISGMYLGIGECVLWCVQIWGSHAFLNDLDGVLCLFPLNCIFLAVRLIRKKMAEWNRLESHGGDAYADKPVLNGLNCFLRKSQYWPLAAFVLMWPLLGILIAILVLFGQKPDAVIKAWTETADWRLSERTAPPQLYYDEHYLCTVAAGGHKKVVKPLRMGERHGHRVVANRQLCIANAFEQILEERTPRFHRAVRHFYDTYGFPVARLIRTKKAADVVYVIMKPLEWVFLLVLYLCDANPENRIAVQYLPHPGRKTAKE